MKEQKKKVRAAWIVNADEYHAIYISTISLGDVFDDVIGVERKNKSLGLIRSSFSNLSLMITIKIAN